MPSYSTSVEEKFLVEKNQESSMGTRPDACTKDSSMQIYLWKSMGMRLESTTGLVGTTVWEQDWVQQYGNRTDYNSMGTGLVGTTVWEQGWG